MAHDEEVLDFERIAHVNALIFLGHRHLGRRLLGRFLLVRLSRLVDALANVNALDRLLDRHLLGRHLLGRRLLPRQLCLLLRLFERSSNA